MRECITPDELVAVLIDIKDKIKQGQIRECDTLIEEILTDAERENKWIDKKYIDNLAERKRQTRIDYIEKMLEEMSLKQIENVFKYVTDEFDEPDHESQALNAIIQLSRKVYE